MGCVLICAPSFLVRPSNKVALFVDRQAGWLVMYSYQRISVEPESSSKEKEALCSQPSEKWDFFAVVTCQVWQLDLGCCLVTLIPNLFMPLCPKPGMAGLTCRGPIQSLSRVRMTSHRGRRPLFRCRLAACFVVREWRHLCSEPSPLAEACYC